MHLFRDGLLATIISHCTSVASVLRHWVYDPAADPHIKLLIRAFRLECLVQRRIMPKWDLHLVLSSLLKPPFASECDIQGEFSDDVIPLKWRTMKTVFLLAMASARRRSYTHALSVAAGRCVFSRGATQRQLVVSLLPEPGFLDSLESTTITGSRMDHRTRDCPSQPVRSEEDAVSCQTAEALHTGLGKNPGGAVNGCLFIGIATSEISWDVTSAVGSWRLSRKPIRKLIESMTELLHMRSEHCQHHGRTNVRWPYLTSCQRRFGGHLGSSRIHIYGTWLVSLMACLLWVQWWLHNKLWIQDIFTLLHSLHDLYAATAMMFLMKITWFLAGIFMYGME